MNIIKEAYENWCRPRMNNIDPDHPFDAFTAGWYAGIKSCLRDTDKVADDLTKRIKELEALIPDARKLSVGW